MILKISLGYVLSLYVMDKQIIVSYFSDLEIIFFNAYIQLEVRSTGFLIKI